MFSSRVISAAFALGLVVMAGATVWPSGDDYSGLSNDITPRAFDQANGDASDVLYKGGALRDVEHLQHGSLYGPNGPKYIGGGAGEGQQFLSPSGALSNKQEVKTDAVLPAYCDPPNPCPPGDTEDDGCSETFQNTAEFSREYQERQNCLCDEDHMFSCPPNHHKGADSLQEGVEKFTDIINALVNKADIKDQHKFVVAKKFQEKRRAKRAVDHMHVAAKYHRQHQNPYLQGEHLRTVAKKGGN